MYDALQRHAALEIGEAYEAHTRRAMTGVANKAGVACKVNRAHEALLRDVPTAIPLNLVPVGAYVCARDGVSARKWRVWRRTELARFDQYTAKPLETRIVLSQNVSVTYAQLNAMLRQKKLRDAHGPVYDIAELFSGTLDAGATVPVVEGAQSAVVAVVTFQPEPIQTVFAFELEQMLGHIKQIEREDLATYTAIAKGIAGTAGTGALVSAASVLSAGAGAVIAVVSAPAAIISVGAATTGAALGLAAGAAAGAGSLTLYTKGRPALTAAHNAAARAAVHVKEKLGGLLGPLSRLRRFLPYGTKGEAQNKIEQLLAEDQAQSLPMSASPDEIKKRLEEAAKKLAAQDAAGVNAGPEFDPLSIEPAMLERAREASLLARQAMDGVLAALSGNSDSR
jgi:hypothetical protein